MSEKVQDHEKRLMWPVAWMLAKLKFFQILSQNVSVVGYNSDEAKFLFL